MHGATKRLRRQAAKYNVDLRGLDHRQQRRLMRRIAAVIWEF